MRPKNLCSLYRKSEAIDLSWPSHNFLEYFSRFFSYTIRLFSIENKNLALFFLFIQNSRECVLVSAGAGTTFSLGIDWLKSPPQAKTVYGRLPRFECRWAQCSRRGPALRTGSARFLLRRRCWKPTGTVDPAPSPRNPSPGPPKIRKHKKKSKFKSFF